MQISQDRNGICEIIDIHTHILPETDDGARGIQESIQLIEQAAAQGITGMIATPHFSRHQSVSSLKTKLSTLREEVKKHNPDFQLYLGQENFYHEELTERLDQGEALTMAESRYVLVEFDPAVSYGQLMRGVRRLSEAGYWPILAHMERYFCLREHGLEEIFSLGCYLQMNFASLQGHWYQKDVRWCRKQVEEGRIQFLGTDLHRTDFRPPEITEAMKWLTHHVNPEHLEEMVHRNPVYILNNERV